MKFIAVDVETANADLSSICQIGLASFENGKLVGKWSTLVNPEDYFDEVNISIHGITEKDVKGCPAFKDIAGELIERFHDAIVVSHTAFDRTSLTRAFTKAGGEIPATTWLDSAKVVRRVWLDFASAGYGLSNVAAHLGIEFQHHDAEEDARVAGEIIVRAIAESGIELEDWLIRSTRPIGGGDSKSGSITREGNAEGPLYGEKVVFTGAFTIPRREIADIAASAGCEVLGGVTKKTTLLVVGDQDLARLSGHSKSSKHRKAEELISKGHQLRILRESDLKELLETSK